MIKDRRKGPVAPLDSYVEAQAVLRHVRVMQRFMDAVDANADLRPHFAVIHCAFMDVLNEELAPYALTLALAVTNLEDAYPEIEKPKVRVTGAREP